MMAFAASSDLFTMTIANRVSLILAGGFILLAVLTGMSRPPILSHVEAAAIVLVVVFVFFSRGWIGGGDAKLAAATTLWMGFGHLTDYLFYASLFGGALTLMIIQFRTIPLPKVLLGHEWAERLHRQRQRRSLRHRARGGGACWSIRTPSGLRRSGCDGAGGRAAAARQRKLTRFGYALLTMP